MSDAEHEHEDADLKARLGKLLADATEDTFDRAIHVAAKLVDEGLDEMDTVMALVDAGRRLRFSARQLDALTGRLAKAMQGVREMRDAKSGKGSKPSGSKASVLVKLAREEFYFSLDDRGLIATPKDGGDPIYGNDFTDQLATSFHDFYGTAPTSAALRDALRVLTGEAQRNAPSIENDDFSDLPEESGSELLGDLAKFVSRFVILPSAAVKDSVALWALHTWAIASFVVSPRLVFRSATWECGKSRALEVLSCLCRTPKLSVLISAASVYRLTESKQPTWFLDEFDQTMESNAEVVAALTAIMNAGYRRGWPVDRQEKVGDNWVTKEFDTFSPMAVAGIMRLKDTTASRSLVVDMLRKLESEHVDEFHIVYTYNDPETITLRRRCAAWAERNAEVLSVVRPELPVGLGDRAKECWGTLMAVADLAGGEWPARATRAAVALSGKGHERGSETNQMLLLSDLRHLWFTRWCDRREGEAPARWFAVSTADILADLTDLEESGWDLFSRVERGKGPITSVDLAKLLRNFGIHSRKIRIENRERYASDDGAQPQPASKPVRGYLLSDLEPHWNRVLPAFTEEDIVVPKGQEAQ